MVRNKMSMILFFVLLIAYQTTAVINKSNPSLPLTFEYKRNDSVEAEKRVGNLYRPPDDDYGPPTNSNYNEISPVYGPPELTGDHRPPQIFDSPPPEQPPPPLSEFTLPQPSFPSYNPLSKVKTQYGLPKATFKPLPSLPNQNFNLPQAQYGPPKPEFGLPKPQYGPPKSQYGPPKPSYGPPLGAFRPPKPEYGSPSKFHIPITSQYNLPSSNSGRPPWDNGVPIPLSIEAYGPPTKDAFAPFVSKPQDNYGPPSLIQTSPQQQYGVPANNDIYNPPPPPPPSGIPAPPTPPDIKYDGWQPIAGLTSDQQQPPLDNYNLPLSSNNYQSSDIFAPPTNTYELPAGDKGSGSEFSLGNGRPAPILSASNVPSDSYGTPLNNPEDHSLKSSVSQSTITHESNGLPPPALPQFEPLHNNQQPIDGSPSINADQHHLAGSYSGTNGNSLSTIKTTNIELPPNPETPIPDFHSNPGDNGLTLQQLPAISSTNYDAPLPSNTYGPFPPSILSNGLFSLPNNLRGGKFPLFNQFDFTFHKNNGNHRNRYHGGHRSPPLPYNGFIPPRRPPTKFRDSVPIKLLSNLNQYLPPNKPYKVYGPPSIQNQQLPTRQNSIFQSSPNSFATSSFGRSNSFKAHTALAAPNANYGIPLSFNDFNTPAPSLTYGAPNFGPASSFGTTGNLYNSAQSNVVPTYGAPAFYALEHDCNKNKDNSPFNFDNGNNDLLKVSASNHEVFPTAQVEGAASANVNDDKLPLSSSYIAPNLNELELKDYEKQQQAFKDSYGNSIDGYKVFDQSNAALNTHENSVPDSSKHSQNSLLSKGSTNPGPENLSAESLTATLTAQSYGQDDKSLSQSNIDAAQFIKSDEASQALALAQSLTADGDGFQIEGSKGTYTLQIQPADGGYGTDNSDGSIRHDQVLSNGLLQNILAAIEDQPEGKQIQLQGEIQSRSADKHNDDDLTNAASSAVVSINESSLIDKEVKQLENPESSNENLTIKNAK